jgi:hypothetical protein
MQHELANESDGFADAIEAREVCLTRRGGLAGPR